MASKKKSLDLTVEEIGELFNDPNWDTPSVLDMGTLLGGSFGTCVQNAIKKITENGYTKEEAERVILKCGPVYGPNDLESNIVERALLSLKSNKEFDDSTSYKFDELKTLACYMSLEMISMVRSINPDISVLDAIWALLICDLDVLNASQLHINPELMGSSSKPAKPETGSGFHSESKDQETIGSNGKKPYSRDPRSSNSGKKVMDTSKDWCSDDSHKHTAAALAIVHKAFELEKSYRGRVNAALKAKIPTWGVLDVVNKQPFSSSTSSSSSGSVHKENKNQSLALKDTKKVTEEPEKSPPNTFDHYLAHIPYDELKGEYVAQDEKDKKILSAVDELRSLTKEFKDWDEWVKKKIMQVTKRLSRDWPELNTLRGEKAEVEKAAKDRLAMEERETKRVLDMKLEFNTTESELNFAISAIDKLQSEQSGLKQNLDVKEEKRILEAKRLSEALIKKKEDLKMAQSIKSERGGLYKDLNAAKRQVTSLQRELQKAQFQLTEREKLLANEEKEIAKILKKDESIKNERLRLEESAKAKKEAMKKNAEETLKRYKNEQKKFEDEINTIKLDEEKKKIEEMRKSVKDPPIRRLEVCKMENDWECVICLERERKVVFVPCGHQVLCEECSRPEKFAMNACPTCMASIQKMIIPWYADS